MVPWYNENRRQWTTTSRTELPKPVRGERIFINITSKGDVTGNDYGIRRTQTAALLYYIANQFAAKVKIRVLSGPNLLFSKAYI